MKVKLIMTGIIAGLIINITHAQTAENPIRKFSIEPYYGFSNIQKYQMTSHAISTGRHPDLEVNSSGVIGIRIGYRLAEKISIGIEGNYTTITASYDRTTVSGSSRYIERIEETQTTYRIMPRINFHFTTTEKVEAYLTVAGGNRSPSREMNNTTYGSVFSYNYSSIAFRIATGIRYFFTPHLGLNLEIGLGGGSIANGGVSFRF